MEQPTLTPKVWGSTDPQWDDSSNSSDSSVPHVWPIMTTSRWNMVNINNHSKKLIHGTGTSPNTYIYTAIYIYNIYIYYIINNYILYIYICSNWRSYIAVRKSQRFTLPYAPNGNASPLPTPSVALRCHRWARSHPPVVWLRWAWPSGPGCESNRQKTWKKPWLPSGYLTWPWKITIFNR